MSLSGAFVAISRASVLFVLACSSPASPSLDRYTPTARFTASSGNPKGTRIVFDASGSTVPHPPATYYWLFGDGATRIATDVKVDHTYTIDLSSCPHLCGIFIVGLAVCGAVPEERCGSVTETIIVGVPQ